MPCMNLMSSPVYCTWDRSDACSAVMTLLACPGAPGCTIGGFGSAAAAVLTPPTGTVRQDATATATSKNAIRGTSERLMTSQEYKVGLVSATSPALSESPRPPAAP